MYKGLLSYLFMSHTQSHIQSINSNMMTELTYVLCVSILTWIGYWRILKLIYSKRKYYALNLPIGKNKIIKSIHVT